MGRCPWDGRGDDVTYGLVWARGAREHNLRDVDVNILRNALVLFSGVSGSGRSSLAFSTIYAEAQRRYFDSVALQQQCGTLSRAPWLAI